MGASTYNVDLYYMLPCSFLLGIFIMGGACLSWVGFSLGSDGRGLHRGSKACQVPLLPLVWEYLLWMLPLYHGWGLPELGWVLP